MIARIEDLNIIKSEGEVYGGIGNKFKDVRDGSC